MNRKIIDFAGAWSGFWGGLGARGVNRAARACSWASMDAKAREPAPQKQLVRNSRRLRLYRMCSGISVHVYKRVQIKEIERQLLQAHGILRLLLEELNGQSFFLGCR